MSGPAAIRDAFRRQAEACDRMGSPFTARLCRLAAARLATGTRVGEAVLAWEGEPRADALALRFAGALHAIVLDGARPALEAAYPPHAVSDAALWGAVEAATEAEADRVLAWLAVPPQTNETARAGALCPGLIAVAAATDLPLVCSEIGASAGLNLNWHRFAYRFGPHDWGDPASPVRIAPDWRGGPPPIRPVVVDAAAGCDLRPIDLDDPEAVLRLEAYVWADQPARLARLRAAIGIARAAGTRVDAADAADWLDARLAERREGRAHVVMHSIMWQYLPEASKARIEAALARAGAAADRAAPLAWLRLERDGEERGAALTLTLWPDGRTRCLARVDFHGNWVEWLAG